MRGEAFMDEYSRDEIKRGRMILKSDWEIVDNFKSDQKRVFQHHHLKSLIQRMHH